MKDIQSQLLQYEIDSWSTIVCSLCSRADTIQSGEAALYFLYKGWKVIDRTCHCPDCQTN